MFHNINLAKDSSDSTSQIVADKEADTYYYGSSQSQIIISLKFDEGKLKSAENITLKYTPSCFDVGNGLIIYVHKNYNFSTKGMFKSAIKGLLMFAMKQKKVNIETLYLEDI